jgi:hypothetical protein
LLGLGLLHNFTVGDFLSNCECHLGHSSVGSLGEFEVDLSWFASYTVDLLRVDVGLLHEGDGDRVLDMCCDTNVLHTDVHLSI